MSKIMKLADEYAAYSNYQFYFPRERDEKRAELAAEVERMEAEIASLRADAERYRFWRNRYPKTFEPTEITPEDVDRMTDAAIQAEGTNHD